VLVRTERKRTRERVCVRVMREYSTCRQRERVRGWREKERLKDRKLCAFVSFSRIHVDFSRVSLLLGHVRE